MKTKIFTVSALLTCLAGLLQAAPGATVFSYQGRVQVSGADFTGNGLFKFALVTVTNTAVTARAEANPPSGGFITVIVVTEAGNGYVTAPIVTITGGGGSNATATASISGGAVTGVSVSNPGSGYSSTPIVHDSPAASEPALHKLLEQRWD